MSFNVSYSSPLLTVYHAHRPSKHTFLKHSAVIRSLAIVFSFDPWVQQSWHVFQLFEIKGCNSFFISSNEPVTTSANNHLIHIVVNLNPMTNATVIKCFLCALYCVRHFADLTAYDYYGISTTTIKMKHREVKSVAQWPTASKQKR